MEPLADMEVQLLVHVLAWIGRPAFDFEHDSMAERSNNRCMLWAVYHFLRNDLPLFGRLNTPNLLQFTKVDADGNPCKKLRC